MIQYPQQSSDTHYEVNTVTEIIKMAKKAKEAGIRDVCLLGLLNVDYRDENNNLLDTREVNRLLRAGCEQLYRRLVDNSNIGQELLWDGLHPNRERGQETMRKNILRCFTTYRF